VQGSIYIIYEFRIKSVSILRLCDIIQAYLQPLQNAAPHCNILQHTKRCPRIRAAWCTKRNIVRGILTKQKSPTKETIQSKRALQKRLASLRIMPYKMSTKLIFMKFHPLLNKGPWLGASVRDISQESAHSIHQSPHTNITHTCKKTAIQTNWAFRA